MSEEPEKKEEEEKTENIINREIEDEMKKAYLDYAMSVIVGRALPNVKDGLKPVHRRILFAMYDMGMVHNKPSKKSARIVGEVLGKYHPHGDTAVYDSMVRMAQDFSLRYPLVKGQGNFGSIDGDSAAAMRYTEAKLNKIAEELLTDIEKETVNFTPNFDGSLKEPLVLPAKLPNLLINGSSGIAVGMATNIPPHNIGEVIKGTIAAIDNPEITIKELMEFVTGPDFPTGGTIQGTQGIAQAYATGRGKIKTKARTEIEEVKGRISIIVTEIPYMVNKSVLIEDIARQVNEKKILGISDIRDESDKDGMRIVIIIKKDANHEIVLNQLFKHSRLEDSFGINLLALVNNEPKTLNLKEIIQEYIIHRKEVVTRRCKFDLRKAEERAHILEGITKALENIDEAIKLIKDSDSVETAKNSLMGRFELTEIQAKAILDTKLQKLTSMEQDKIKEELKALKDLMEKLREILASEEMIFKIIKDELEELHQKYADPRKTGISEIEDEDIEIEDLIEKEDMVVTISHSGYIKRTPVSTYKQQNRGGTGIIAAETKEEDFVEKVFIGNTHSYLLLFTNKGKIHWRKVFQIPEASRTSKGKHIANFVELEKDETVTAFIPIKEFAEGKNLFMATENGIVKKTALKFFSKPRKGGIRAITLSGDDSLVNVKLTDSEKQIILATKNGMAVKFKETDVRPVGRSAQGVKGINLRKDDKVIGMVRARDDRTLFTLTKNGYGKRTPISDYRLINRGGIGVINIQCSERNSTVVSIKSVEEDNELMLISRNGQLIRIPAHGVSVIGRNTQGVRVMKLRAGDTVVAAASLVTEKEAENPEEAEDSVQN